MRGIAFCLTLILWTPLIFAEDEVSRYKHCDMQYQNLLARQADIARLRISVQFHKQAFEKFNQGVNEKIANYHKQYLNYQSQILIQQKRLYQQSRFDYKQNCAAHSILTESPSASKQKD